MPRGQAGAQHAPCCGGGCVMNARSFSTLETYCRHCQRPCSVHADVHAVLPSAHHHIPHIAHAPLFTPCTAPPTIQRPTAQNPTPNSHTQKPPHTQSATNYTTTTTTTTPPPQYTTTYVHRHIHFSPLIHPGASFSSSLPHLPPRHLLVTSSPVPHCTKRPDLNGVPPDGGVHARPDG